MYNFRSNPYRFKNSLRSPWIISSIWEIFSRFRWFTLTVLFILPIYPSLSVLGSPNLETDVGDYDESTIITAYEWDIENWNSLVLSDAWMVRSVDETSKKEVKTSQNKLLSYTTQWGDTLTTIAKRFNVTPNSIIWANDLEETVKIKPGMPLRIPPVSWVVHVIKKWDTISEIASTYSIDAHTILEYNKLSKNSTLNLWKELIIPGWAQTQKIAQKIENTKTITTPNVASKEIKTPTKDTSKNIVKKSETPVTTKKTASDVKPKEKKYTIKYTGNGRWFAWWNCTWYVAQYKNVSWRWNANQWLRNAKAQWVPTWKTPAPWSIVQLTWQWYNRYYGHVGIVMDIEDDDIIIKDMNYRWLWEVTIRRIPKDSKTIDWYIYVN